MVGLERDERVECARGAAAGEQRFGERLRTQVSGADRRCGFRDTQLERRHQPNPPACCAAVSAVARTRPSFSMGFIISWPQLVMRRDMQIRTATCRCGQLKALCEGEPVRVSVCHCLECQKC